ncbi:MAG: hypothetical protein H6Q74_840 [Firmicutes bacterium]|nr:hypothetical protein [Bacillota bacterium]
MTITTSVRNYIIISLVVAVVGILIGAGAMYKWGPKQVVTVTSPSTGNIITPLPLTTQTAENTQTAVVPITQPGDLVQFREQQSKIVAIVNDKEYEVPNTTGSTQVELGTSGQLEIEHQTTSQIDMTPIVNQLLAEQLNEEHAKWAKEIKHHGIGVGVGYHDEWYIPIEYQTDYAKNRAISFEIHKDIGLNYKIIGGEIKHIWRF